MRYNSYDKNHKAPFGAVKQGEVVRFCVAGAGISAVVLLLKCADGEYSRINMTADNGNFTLSYAFAEPGVYFYHFALLAGGGETMLWRAENGGESYSSGCDFQQTVYVPFTAPELDGIIYQIFPDRFFSAPITERVHYSDRVYPRWGEPVLFAGGEHGAVINNDYFGGNLRGIIQKLGYLSSLSVSAIYLNPIFEAHSNHRYNTADYMNVDPLLGSNEDFSLLCEKARERGIRIILDGVFSHTGSDSVYFNKNGRYNSVGAYQSQSSPYSDWYSFRSFPYDYDCWWGFKTLPEVKELNSGFCEFVTGKDGVIEHWMNLGASGFRLDVADELPDEFIAKIRCAIRRCNPEGVLYGEVWEDASNKRSYNTQRAFLLGQELDSVMNYPFRELILQFIRNGGGIELINGVMTLIEHYPSDSARLMMNFLSTHDTVRAITELGGEPQGNHDRSWQAAQQLNEQQYNIALRRLRLAALLQYTLPGTPCMYYGDELPTQGYRDPFNRACFDWQRTENNTLLSLFRSLGRLRRACPALHGGGFLPAQYDCGYVSYLRVCESGELYVIVNPSDRAVDIWLLPGWATERVLLGATPENGILRVQAGEFALLGRGEWAADFST